MYMRIDPVQVVASEVQAPMEKPKERAAAEPRLVEASRAPAINHDLVPAAAPKYEVTVQFDHNQIMITKFIDQKSGELVQQIPSEQVMKIIESIQQLLQESSQRMLDIFP
jgi:FlaG protein